MNKSDIKNMLRESLFKLDEVKKTEPKGEYDNANNKKDVGEKKSANEKPLDQRDQTAIINALDKDKNPLAPAISQVMKKVTGENPNDATARSEFRKKIKQKDGLGLTDQEKDRTEVALGIK